MESSINKPLDDSTKHFSELSKSVIQINGRSLLFKGTPKSNLIYKVYKKERDIEFYKFESQTFYKNLLLIDSDLPRIVAQLLLYRYKGNESNFFKLITILEKENPLGYPQDSERSYYLYKLKKMLRDMSMGMTAETAWNGESNTYTVTLVLGNDGKVVCYHAYDIQKLETYLINNTYLETSSTGENKNKPDHPKSKGKGKNYNFGWLYDENGEVFLKLNLQVGYLN